MPGGTGGGGGRLAPGGPGWASAPPPFSAETLTAASKAHAAALRMVFIEFIAPSPGLMRVLRASGGEIPCESYDRVGGVHTRKFAAVVDKIRFRDSLRQKRPRHCCQGLR